MRGAVVSPKPAARYLRAAADELPPRVAPSRLATFAVGSLASEDFLDYGRHDPRDPEATTETGLLTPRPEPAR